MKLYYICRVMSIAPHEPHSDRQAFACAVTRLYLCNQSIGRQRNENNDEQWKANTRHTTSPASYWQSALARREEISDGSRVCGPRNGNRSSSILGSKTVTLFSSQSSPLEVHRGFAYRPRSGALFCRTNRSRATRAESIVALRSASL